MKLTSSGRHLTTKEGPDNMNIEGIDLQPGQYTLWVPHMYGPGKSKLRQRKKGVDPYLHSKDHIREDRMR